MIRTASQPVQGKSIFAAMVRWITVITHIAE